MVLSWRLWQGARGAQALHTADELPGVCREEQTRDHSVWKAKGGITKRGMGCVVVHLRRGPGVRRPQGQYPKVWSSRVGVSIEGAKMQL